MHCGLDVVQVVSGLLVVCVFMCVGNDRLCVDHGSD